MNPLNPSGSVTGHSLTPFRLETPKMVLLQIVQIQMKMWHFIRILDWLQSLKQFFINVPYHILVDSLTLMALF